MPRTARIYKPHFFYHIYNRGNNRDAVLKHAEDKQLFINLLYKNIRKTDLRLIAFCIMDNHFHLIIKTGNNPRIISKFMQSVTISYAMQINKKYKRVGHVFQGRYNANILRYKKDLEQATTYIRKNPVVEGLVKHPKDYPWCKF